MALAAPVLIGLGVTELSATAAAIPRIKAFVRRLDMAACQRPRRRRLRSLGRGGAGDADAHLAERIRTGAAIMAEAKKRVTGLSAAGNASFDILQKIGKSLMLPVAVLPVAGLLLLGWATRTSRGCRPLSAT